MIENHFQYSSDSIDMNCTVSVIVCLFPCIVSVYLNPCLCFLILAYICVCVRVCVYVCVRVLFDNSECMYMGVCVCGCA